MLMLKSKPILAPKEKNDGVRISIMSRHTLSDGKTPDERLTADRFHEHRPEFAAPGWAVGGYYRGELSFDEYAYHYGEYLRTQQAAVIALVQKALTEDITVMCIEDTPEHCHRRLFIEYSQALADMLNMPLTAKIG